MVVALHPSGWASWLALLHPVFWPRPAVGFKVIGAGDPKTGLTSLTEALELLGYSVYRAFNQTIANKHKSHRAMWKEALNTTSHETLRGLVDEIMALGFDAILDVPANVLALPLLRLFPNAKVILSVRSTSSAWFASFKENIMISAQLRYPPYKFSRQNRLHVDIDNIIWGPRGCIETATGHATDGNSESCIASHEHHNEVVRRAVPSSQLLEFQVSHGWEPLCRFLKVSQPSRPFPQQWTRGSVTYTRYAMYLNTAVSYVVMVGLPAWILWCCVRCTRRCPRRTAAKTL